MEWKLSVEERVDVVILLIASSYLPARTVLPNAASINVLKVYFGSVSSADAAPIQVVAIVAATDATNTLFRIDFRCGFIVLPPGDSKRSCGD
ncbi:MAG: hypothetical protein OEO82_11815, partial [Gammaproteobacteria bacterium]|nr:hypothetical protein [Gammaproteobacteria bacterium]